MVREEPSMTERWGAITPPEGMVDAEVAYICMVCQTMLRVTASPSVVRLRFACGCGMRYMVYHQRVYPTNRGLRTMLRELRRQFKHG